MIQHLDELTAYYSHLLEHCGVLIAHYAHYSIKGCGVSCRGKKKKEFYFVFALFSYVLTTERYVSLHT